MRNYKDSDYALNRYSQGIVYKFSDGIVEITLEAYLRDNPGKTEADFLELKALSDEIYHEQVVQEHRTSRLDVSIDGLDETALTAAPSLDMAYIRKNEETEALKAAKDLLESGMLTVAQQRRLQLYYFQGLSTRQIARMEGVHQRAVWDSLMWAGKKLKKFYTG